MTYEFSTKSFDLRRVENSLSLKTKNQVIRFSTIFRSDKCYVLAWIEFKNK